MKRALALFAVTTVSACAASPERPNVPPVTTARPADARGAAVATDAGGPVTPSHRAPALPTFADDWAFLAKNGAVKILEGEGGARVLVSGKYQARVMTSAVEEKGQSFGFINRSFIEGGRTGSQFDNYGGEDRLWLGPEGGQFGLYFEPGKPFTFDAWQVPHAMQEGAWDEVTAATGPEAKECAFARKMELVNWTGTKFSIDIRRTVRVLDRAAAKTALGLDPGAAQMVAYVTENEITNAGASAWKKETGLVSLWVLAMFAPAADGRVVIPFKTGAPGKPIVNDAYFGKVPAERLQVSPDKGVLFFTVDGKERGKIGLGPARAKTVAGSYSPSARLLTIVQYDPKPDAAAPYVNSMWEQQKEPYAGDVLNSYNDGPTGPGKPALGGFYELETSSPALELAPKQSRVHRHRTFHFVGDAAALDPIAKAVLGVSLSDVASRGSPTP